MILLIRLYLRAVLFMLKCHNIALQFQTTNSCKLGILMLNSYIICLFCFQTCNFTIPDICYITFTQFKGRLIYALSLWCTKIHIPMMLRWINTLYHSFVTFLLLTISNSLNQHGINTSQLTTHLICYSQPHLLVHPSTTSTEFPQSHPFNVRKSL